ncbi:MAG TPA: ABC transporter ATP-binding protein [Gemmatimonadaceae bacterium]|nr:ABC transporter ATP-binding protein [Gemmatimonadaceae bacterium]
MSDASVSFRHVWKKFRYGEVHNSLRDLLPALGRRLIRRASRDDRRDLQSGDFWALRDVSFEVRPGEAIGIIGPNGAGKSTVLKLLTRIVRPTRGGCSVRGRIGALIELSAGFHPDLTGRENIYLQGSIMGMHRGEIAAKFDEIVEFAGIPDFIDTPVKRYSSGMHARLGFAIAAHLDPDVLIIDEVLAVGDAAFQQKAFGRIAQMREQQVPLVVVSHQLDRIAQLCTKAILLNRGRVVHSGTPGDTIAAYVGNTSSTADAIAGDSATRIESMRLRAPAEVPSGSVITVVITGTVRPHWTGTRESVMLRVASVESGITVFSTDTALNGIALPYSGAFTLEIDLQLNVPSNVYTIQSLVWDTLTSREVFPGPSAQVNVAEGLAFVGSVQMNPRLRLEHGESAAAPTDDVTPLV